MKKLICATALITFGIIVCTSVYSQDKKTPPGWAEKITFTNDPYITSNSQPNLFMQAGTFYSNSALGIETTIRPPNSHFYGALFLGNMINFNKMPDIRNFSLAGVTFGYETLLHPTNLPVTSTKDEVLRTDVEGIQIYARVGTGLGVGAINREDRGSGIHPMIHTTTTVGALKNIARRTFFYAELGGRIGWFPTIVDMELLAGPHMSMGVLIFPGKLFR